MTSSPKNIIELVRELQGRWLNLEKDQQKLPRDADDAYWLLSEKDNLETDIFEAFPSITQALLIAVKAMETIVGQPGYAADQDPDVKPEWAREIAKAQRNIAQEALSRLHQPLL